MRVIGAVLEGYIHLCPDNHIPTLFPCPSLQGKKSPRILGCVDGTYSSPLNLRYHMRDKTRFPSIVPPRCSECEDGQ